MEQLIAYFLLTLIIQVCNFLLYFQMHRIETSDDKTVVTRLMGETLKRMEQMSRRKSFQLENVFSGGTTRSPRANGSGPVVADSE